MISLTQPPSLSLSLFSLSWFLCLEEYCFNATPLLKARTPDDEYMAIVEFPFQLTFVLLTSVFFYRLKRKTMLQQEGPGRKCRLIASDSWFLGL